MEKYNMHVMRKLILDAEKKSLPIANNIDDENELFKLYNIIVNSELEFLKEMYDIFFDETINKLN